jgi:hypothetical protein
MEQFFGIYDGELDAGFCQDIIRRFEKNERKVEGMGGCGQRRGRRSPRQGDQ